MVALPTELLSPGEVANTLVVKKSFEEVVLVQEIKSQRLRKLFAQRGFSAGG